MKKEKKKLFVFFTIGLLLRFILAFSFEATGDTGGWILGGKTLLEQKQYGLGNGTVYDGDCPSVCANWPPLTFHYLGAMRFTYLHINPFGLPEWGFYKLLPVLADSAVILLLYFIAIRQKMKSPLGAAAFYAFHPIALFVAGYHGQRDVVWLFFLLLSMYLHQQNRYWSSSVVLALGTAVKFPIIIFLPYIFLITPGFAKKITYVLLFALSIVVASSPEIFQYPLEIYRQVVQYKGAFGLWGISAIFAKVGPIFGYQNLPQLLYNAQKYIMYGAILLITLLCVKRRMNPYRSLLAIGTTLLALAPSYASQYLIWIVPLLVVNADTFPKYLHMYTVIGGFLSLNFYTFFNIPMLKHIIVFLQDSILFKIPGFLYPFDLAWPLWILTVYYMYRLIKNSYE